MRLDAAPHRPFRGDAHRIGRDRQRGDPEPLKVPRPGRLVGKVPIGMGGQPRDHRTRQGALAHVGQGLGVDHVIAVAGPQQLEEVQPALRSGGGKRGEMVVAELGAEHVAVLVAGAGVVNADPARRRQPGPQHIARLVEEGALALVQQPDDLAFRDRDADGPELRHQPRYGDLALVVLE